MSKYYKKLGGKMYLVDMRSVDTIGAYHKTESGLIAGKTGEVTDKPKYATILQVGDEAFKYKEGDLIMLLPTIRKMEINYDGWTGTLIPEGDIIGSLIKK